ncbi:MAG: hypothetical protein ACI8W7_004714 [Gammaproteobacteria bacterium]|jgi:uncharacterized protein (TIRG00374 family)
MKPQHLALLRIVMSVMLLALAWRLVDGDSLLRLLRTMDIALLFIAVALTIPMHVLSALRWQLTCKRIGMQLSLPDALREYYLASLLNTVLPGGVSGDAARVWRQAERYSEHRVPAATASAQGRSRYRRPLHGVLVERFAGQCALFAVLGMGVAVNHQRLSPVRDLLLAVVVLIVLAALVWWVLVRQANAAASSTTRWRSIVREFHADARHALLPLPVLALQSALSLAVVTSYLAIFWVAAQAVHAPLDLASALLAIPLVLTAMTLPISVGGLGLRESAAAVLWPALSLSPSDGAASALTYGVVILIGALPGIPIALMRRRQAA